MVTTPAAREGDDTASASRDLDIPGGEEGDELINEYAAYDQPETRTFDLPLYDPPLEDEDKAIADYFNNEYPSYMEFWNCFTRVRTENLPESIATINEHWVKIANSWSGREYMVTDATHTLTERS